MNKLLMIGVAIIFFVAGMLISIIYSVNRDYDYDLFETETYKNIEKVEHNKEDKEFKIYKKDGNIETIIY